MNQKRLEPEITPSEFFDGVAEMRAYLDRNSSQSGRELLAQMALELSKPRSFDALCQWFCTAITRALAARGAALLLEVEGAYVIQATYGVVQQAPVGPGTTLAGGPEATLAGGTLMSLIGAHATFGALWVEHAHPIDASLAGLAAAVIDAVAMAIESLRERTA